VELRLDVLDQCFDRALNQRAQYRARVSTARAAAKEAPASPNRVDIP